MKQIVDWCLDTIAFAYVAFLVWYLVVMPIYAIWKVLVQ